MWALMKALWLFIAQEAKSAVVELLRSCQRPQADHTLFASIFNNAGHLSLPWLII